MIRSTSWKRSTTMIGVRPSRCAEQRRLDVRAVLVAVADDQRAGRLEQRQRDQQLGLAAGLEADAVLAAPYSTISSTTWRCWLTLIGYTPR